MTTTATTAPSAARETAPLLSVQNLDLRFGGIAALDDVSFDIAEGELFAIIGPNGAGKTCIFNCLNGVYVPRVGHAFFDGHDLIGAPPARIARWGVGRTFQNLGLFTNLDLVENLMLGRHTRMRTGYFAGAVWFGRARREEIVHRRHCEEIVDFLELGEHRGQPVGMLPYGIQKRIELGRALAMEPRLLLLDEPVAGMNLEEIEDTARYILEIRNDLGITTILVEHDMRMVMDIADRVLALDFGQVIASGTPSEIQSNRRVIEAYLGQPS